MNLLRFDDTRDRLLGRCLRRQAEKAIRLLRNLVDYFLENPDEMPESYRQRDEPLVNQVIDVVAGMTDRYALRIHDQIYRPF